jgi:hypothetical protein
MGRWTAASVERALRAAAETRLLIERGCGGEIDHSVLSALALAPQWMSLVDDPDADIVRLRSSGSRWKPICWQLGCGRATAHRRFKTALQRIADHLNRESSGLETSTPGI